MREICDSIRLNVPAILEDWNRLAREQPWYSLPPENRTGNLADLIVALADVALCEESDPGIRQRKVDAAVVHGEMRRHQGVPEQQLLTEFHLLRQALWYFLHRTRGANDETATAIMRVDAALTLATNATMWGYYAEEIRSLGQWEEGIQRIITASPWIRSPGREAESA